MYTIEVCCDTISFYLFIYFLRGDVYEHFTF